MRKSLTSRRKEIFTSSATRLWKSRGVFSKSQPHGRKRSWLIRRWLSPQRQEICRSSRQAGWRPLAREKIPIIADEAIDPEFGTGVLKVTPAHDKLDFEIGQRHNLPVVDVLHHWGINCPAVPELNGLDRFEARKRAAELLKEKGLLSKTEPYENNVGFSERSDVPIEPRISEQWFLRYPKTKEALAVVRDHLIRFFPAHWEKVYAQWLENIRDWCISRQVWWGHRIPAWYRKSQSRGERP